MVSWLVVDWVWQVTVCRTHRKGLTLEGWEGKQVGMGVGGVGGGIEVGILR